MGEWLDWRTKSLSDYVTDLEQEHQQNVLSVQCFIGVAEGEMS
jgi:hypothetical protein